MTRLRTFALALTVLAATVAGCGNDGVTRPPPANMRVIHVAPTYGRLTFRREEERNPIGALDFGEGAAASFDSGPYDFNVDYAPAVAGGANIRVAVMPATLNPEPTYTFVLTDAGAELTPFVVESTPLELSGSDVQTEIIHAAASGGNYDAYLEPSGANLVAATPIGSIGYRQSLPPERLAAGDFRLYLTAPGNPSDVRFESITFSLPALSASILVIKEEGGVGAGTQTLDVVLFGTSTVTLPAVAARSQLSAINSISDMTARDVTLDEAYVPPLFPAVAHGIATDYASVAPGAHDLSVTPVGNPVDELNEPIDLLRGRAHTVLLTGDSTNGIRRLVILDDLRPRIGEASLRVTNGASLLGAGLDFYILPPGTSIDSVFPLARLAAPGVSERYGYPPGEYEVTLRAYETQTIVAGPTTVTVEDQGVYGILAIDAVGGSTADLVLQGDFN